MSGIIIDHSHSPAKRSTGNNTKLSKRLRARVKEAVNDAANKGHIQDMSKGFKVRLKGLSQPTFRNDQRTGTGRRVFPGNSDYTPGDLLDKPSGRSGSGSKGSNSGEGEDDFLFEVPPDLARELLLEDLALPSMVKKQLGNLTQFQQERAGYVSSGPASNLSMTETARKALGRRIALKRPKRKELDDIQRQINVLKAKPDKSEADHTEIDALQKRWNGLKRKRGAIPFVDTGDLRYRRFEPQPKPVTQAVMFCLMDVSASMGEHEKDLSKRFFYLLHLFLTMHYPDGVHLVFIRHTQVAREVDQQEFFFGRDTGGTVASSALELMRDIIKERYPLDQWNIYGCQCSDGDDFTDDATYCQHILEEELLPVVQYFAYLEVGGRKRDGSPLWDVYEDIDAENFDYEAAWERSMIYPVFRRFFESDSQKSAA